MVGWHHVLDGHGFEQTPGDSEGQESLACCSPWGHKESDTTSWLNNIKNMADSCCCMAETITISYSNYYPVKNKIKFKKKIS